MPAVKLLEHGRQRLDRYELVGEIASGGMATVYLARIIGVGGFQRFVAVKRLHPHLASEQEFIEMFLDEARLAASIHHPNVVPILEVGTSDRGYYLVMEYIEGDTLARLLARATTLGESIPPPIVIRIVLDTLAGLHAAHELRDDQDQLLGLVHRDVSPQNILVGIDGTSRITDFGVARAATRLSSTRAGQLKGKLAYMAPEQARGAAIDRRADLFAIGTVLWESLADRRLFKGDAEAETLNRVLFEPIPRLRTVVPGIPALIESAVMKALERDPEKRHANALEFCDQLERSARATHRLASMREVAQYVQNAIGQDISQQREAVRIWLAQSEPSRTELDDRKLETPVLVPAAGPALTSTTTSTSVLAAPSQSQSAPLSGERPVLSRNKSAVSRRWLVTSVAAVVLIGGIGWLYASSTDRRHASSPPAAVSQSSLSRGVSSSAGARGGAPPAATHEVPPTGVAPSTLPTSPHSSVRPGSDRPGAPSKPNKARTRDLPSADRAPAPDPDPPHLVSPPPGPPLPVSPPAAVQHAPAVPLPVPNDDLPNNPYR